MGGEMKARILKIGFIISLIFIIIGISNLATSTDLLDTQKAQLSNDNELEETINMFIFISPQYSQDDEIINSSSG